MKKTILIATLLASVMFCIPAYADSRSDTGIPEYEITITLDGDLYTGTAQATSATEHTSIDSVSVDNSQNLITVTVEADDGYYFSLKKASQVLITGGNYIKGTKYNDSKQFVLQLSRITGGNWVDDENGRRFQLPDGSYWDPAGWAVFGRGYYYFSNNGYILTNCQTPDGYRVDETGKWVMVIDTTKTESGESGEETASDVQL